MRHTPLNNEELWLHFADEEDEDENERDPPNLEEEHEQNVSDEPFNGGGGKRPGQHFGRVFKPALQVCRLKSLESIEVFEQGRDCVGGFKGHVVLRHWIKDLIVAADEVDVSRTSQSYRAFFEVVGTVFVLQSVLDQFTVANLLNWDAKSTEKIVLSRLVLVQNRDN